MSTTHVEKIWGQSILTQGFTAIPNILPRIYRKLNISHGELGLILNILTHKHNERNPFPSYATLAEYMDVSTKQIQNWVKSLVEKGLLIVQQRKNGIAFGSNEYDFSSLVQACLGYLGMDSEEPEVTPAIEEHVPPKKTSTNTKQEDDDYISNPDIFIQEFIEQTKEHNLPSSVIKRIIPKIKGCRFTVSVLRKCIDIFISKYTSGCITSVGAYMRTLLDDQQCKNEYKCRLNNETFASQIPFPFFNWLEA